MCGAVKNQLKGIWSDQVFFTSDSFSAYGSYLLDYSACNPKMSGGRKDAFAVMCIK